MAITYKVLGQIYPAASTLTTAYTVPSATNGIVSTIVVNNQGTLGTAYSISVEPSGTVSTGNKNYIAKSAFINGLDSHYITIGITLNASDVIKCFSENGLVSFNLFGSEIG